MNSSCGFSGSETGLWFLTEPKISPQNSIYMMPKTNFMDESNWILQITKYIWFLSIFAFPPMLFLYMKDEVNLDLLKRQTDSCCWRKSHNRFSLCMFKGDTSKMLQTANKLNNLKQL